MFYSRRFLCSKNRTESFEWTSDYYVKVLAESTVHLKNGLFDVEVLIV